MARETLIDDLRRILPPDRVLTDPAELFVYESDGFTIAHSRPTAVVFPISTEEVVAVVQTLVRHDAQIVPRGTGTGLAGGCVAYDLGVVVSTAKMNRILKIDLDNRVAHVEAGCRNLALSDAVAALPLEGSGFRGQGSGGGGNPGLASDPTPQTSPARDPEAARAGQPVSASASFLNPKPRTLNPLANPYHFAPDPSSQRASSIGGNAA